MDGVVAIAVGLHLIGRVGIAPAALCVIGLVGGAVEDSAGVGVHQDLAQGSELLGAAVHEVDDAGGHHGHGVLDHAAVVQGADDGVQGGLTGALDLGEGGGIPDHIGLNGLLAADLDLDMTGQVEGVADQLHVGQVGEHGDLAHLGVLQLVEVVPQGHVVPGELVPLGEGQLIGAESAGEEPDGADVAHGGPAGVGAHADAQIQVGDGDLAHIRAGAGQLPIEVGGDGAAVAAVIDGGHMEPLLRQLRGELDVSRLAVGRRGHPGRAVVDEEVQVALRDAEGHGAVALAHDHVEGAAAGGVYVGPQAGLDGEAVVAADDRVEGVSGAHVVHQEVAAQGDALLLIADEGGGGALLGEVGVEAVAAQVADHGMIGVVLGHLPGGLHLGEQVGVGLLAQQSLKVLGEGLIGLQQGLSLIELLGRGDHQTVDLRPEAGDSVVLRDDADGAVGGGEVVEVGALHGVGDQGVAVLVHLRGGQGVLAQDVGAAAGVAGALRAVVDGEVSLVGAGELIGVIGGGQVIGGEVQGLGLHGVPGGHGHGRIAAVAGDGEPLHPGERAGVGALEVGEEEAVHGVGVLAHHGEGLTVPHGLHGAVAVPDGIFIAGGEHHSGADAQEAVAAGVGLRAVHGDIQSDGAVVLHGVDHVLGQSGHVGEGQGEGEGGEAVLILSHHDAVCIHLGILTGALPGSVVVAVVVVDGSSPEVGHRTLFQQGLTVIDIVGDGAGGLVDREAEEVAVGHQDGVGAARVHGHIGGRGRVGDLRDIGGHLELLMGHLMAGVGPQGVLRQLHDDVQIVLRPGLGLGGHVLQVGDLDGLGLLGRHAVGDGAGVQDVAVLHELPLHVEVAQIQEAVLVLHGHGPPHQVGLVGSEPEALILVLDLVELGHTEMTHLNIR